MKSCGLCCTAAHRFCGILSQFFKHFSFFLKLSFTLPEICPTALFGIVSSPFSNTDSIQFTTLFSAISHLLSSPDGVALSRSSSSFLFWLLILVLCRSLSCSASDKLYLNVISTFPIVCWRNKYKWVLSVFPAEKRWRSLDPPWGLPRDALPPPPESVRTAFVWSLSRTLTS